MTQLATKRLHTSLVPDYAASFTIPLVNYKGKTCIPLQSQACANQCLNIHPPRIATYLSSIRFLQRISLYHLSLTNGKSELSGKIMRKVPLVLKGFMAKFSFSMNAHIDRGRSFVTVWEELPPIQSATTLRRNRLVRSGKDALLSSHLCALGICIKGNKTCPK